ncbi:MAG: 5-(carboxyamino)imidazole ribonucleotide synthase [Hyphomicrobiaceae bacterium]
MTARTPAPLPVRVPPGGTIGILGGGQLGRMLAMAAARLGLRCHVYSDTETGPAADVSAKGTTGDYDDFDRLADFARDVDVVTFEFENVPVAAATHLESIKPVFPPPKALAIAQDRLVEKDFMSELGIAVAPYAAVDDDESLAAAVADIGTPALLKTRRLGYDGKGQFRLTTPAEVSAARSAIGEAPTILEGFVAFECEVSVLMVRGYGAEEPPRLVDRAYDIPTNSHKDGILDRSIVPSDLPDSCVGEAVGIAARIADALDYRGVLAVELFVVRQSDQWRLVVNEIAPRVHNSGHWTMDACQTDQFENHIRAVAGWPIGSTDRHSNAEMINLIGGDAHDWLSYASRSDCSVHLYGKHDVRPGRKMGHVNRIWGR